MTDYECRAPGATPTVPIRAQPGGFAIFKNSPCVWPESMAGQPDSPLRVHVVDSDAHVRGVISQELMGDSRTVVAGQAGSLRDGRRLVRDLGFDVLLVDVALSDGAGFDLMAHAKSLNPKAEVIALSKHETDDDAMRAFELGAAGFVVKNSWFVSFVQAVLQVANGGAAITPALSRRLLLKRGASAATHSVPGPSGEVVRIKLSLREHEVLRMIASGLTSSQIGDKLAISSTTVNSHVKNMYHKLHVRSRAQAVSCANTWGLL
ncbi:response regulator transcription factor [Ramlibacter henchirensis]|uniref:Response regulator transcription factor n=1 Tax=Ramlibacter henchirensis TaxID=204072 RepID=A0A4Z0BPL0_9BURK|nr:response regulator transcription factor [Ramlibacter henchirensis]TFZ00702.1 response regulator transcription factor [Ramlibacter henchirensis]